MTRPLRIAAGGLTFDAVHAGPDDRPLVLFLHGWPEFADSWSRVLPRIGAAGYRAVAFDQRGYSPGARPREVADYRLAHLVRDALAVADALGAGRFHLVGHDWGGLVAWALAARHPERLDSLTVLATPHPRALFGEADEDQRERLGYVRLLRTAGKAERVLLEDDARRLRGLYGDAVDPAWIARNVSRLREPEALTATLNWYRASADDPDLTGVGPVTVPTLYVWGARDLALGRAAAEATARWVEADYRFAPVEQASHWLPEEVPDTVTALLLDRLGAGPRPA